MSADHAIPKHKRFINLAGIRFGRLVASRFAGKDRHKHSLWECDCDCGKRVVVSVTDLRCGDTKSCGCLKIEVDATKFLTHGLARKRKRHPEYSIWVCMRDRCNNPRHKNYDRYGGRGITVCVRWDSYVLFIKDMGPRPSAKHSIDRKNNDGNYEPDNCRWATATEQMRNRTGLRAITFDGRTQLLTDWAKEVGITIGALWMRLHKGVPLEKALTAKSRYWRHHSR